MCVLLSVSVCPQALMTVERIEKLFMSHHQWERGDIGMLCSDETERKTIFERQQFVLQFFLGFLKLNSQSCKPYFGFSYNNLVWFSSNLVGLRISSVNVAFSAAFEVSQDMTWTHTRALGRKRFISVYRKQTSLVSLC